MARGEMHTDGTLRQTEVTLHGCPRPVFRTRLFALSIGLVKDVQCNGLLPERGPEGCCDNFRIALPYRGLYLWHVGRHDLVADANQVMFMAAGEPYQLSGPTREPVAAMMVIPDRHVLEEMGYTAGRRLADHPAFARRSRHADPRLQHFRMRFLYWLSSASTIDTLEAEELLLGLLQSALRTDRQQYGPNIATTSRLIRRTKEFLDGAMSNPVRLGDIAREVGASPAYLTDLFRKVEGVSLHKYLMHLRLARALVELPHAENLTALAFALGFSSHSHFSFAFRRAFGATPSQFQEDVRAALPPRMLRGTSGRQLPRK
jgi:AraC family transcriptional regulator